MAKAAKKASIKGKTPVSKAAIKRQVTKRGDQAPEAKSSAKAASDAAQKMFDDADASGQPALTDEQRENQQRRAVFGY